MLSPATKRLAHRILEGKPADPAGNSRFVQAVAGRTKKPAKPAPSDAQRLADYARSDADRLARYATRPLSEATEKGYGFDWSHFASWCDAAGREHLPATPETIALYLDAYRESLAPATLVRRIVAIGAVHAEQGLPHPGHTPLVRNVLSTIKRERGTTQRQVEPALTEDIRAMVDSLPKREPVGTQRDTSRGLPDASLSGDGLTPLALRDRLLLLLGFLGAFRRSELAALSWNDIRCVREGLEVNIRRSKTDQEGKGRKLAIPRGDTEAYCPVLAFHAWNARMDKPKAGYIFVRIDRHGNIYKTTRIASQAVAIVVKRCAGAVGLDPALYAGHSLRAGLATSAHLGGATETAIMRQTGHKSAEMVRRYIRKADLWKNNPAKNTGL